MCFNSLIINVLSFCFCLSFVIVLRLARNRVFCKVSNFYHHSFVFYFFFRNFALVKRFVNIYNGVDMMHKEMYFSVFFNVIYLEVSNILLITICVRMYALRVSFQARESCLVFLLTMCYVICLQCISSQWSLFLAD